MIFTDKFLDYLKEYDGRATFFVVGNLIDARQNTFTEMMEIALNVAVSMDSAE